MKAYLTTVFGITLILWGFACWPMGLRRVIKRALKRHGIANERRFPFEPMTIPYSKLNRKDWLEILGYVVLCGMLISAGNALLK